MGLPKSQGEDAALPRIHLVDGVHVLGDAKCFPDADEMCRAGEVSGYGCREAQEARYRPDGGWGHRGHAVTPRTICTSPLTWPRGA